MALMVTTVASGLVVTRLHKAIVSIMILARSCYHGLVLSLLLMFQLSFSRCC